ncbi:MAG: LysR family transcriptional regulator [Pseudomonadota bacterium]
MINARQLEVLCAVIEVGTTAGAAQELGVSQPAVSNMIRHTEDLIGFNLFERKHGRLVPTPEALRIEKEAQHLFMQQKRINAIIEELRDGVIGKLHLVVTPSVGLSLIPRIMSDFVKARPKLNISLELGSIDEIQERLVSGRADLGISITQPRHSLLNVSVITKGHLVLVCPVGHELAMQDRVEVADLNRYRHISYSSSTPLGRAVDRVFDEKGLPRHFFAEARHTAVALEMVANGLGVALVDEFGLVERRNNDVVVVPTNPKLPINLHAVNSNLFPVSLAAGEFAEAVKRHIEDKRTAID